MTERSKDEQEEFEELKSYMDICSLGDRPQSPEAEKLRRYLELSDKPSYKPERKGIGSHHSAKMKKDEWLTPPHILDAFPAFDLDPCAPVNPPWIMAKQQYTVNSDGLTKTWLGSVWCNPPYGLVAAKWLQKMSEHNNGIALIFARTETKMFFKWVWGKASAVLFLEGRLHFHHVDGTRASANAGAPSCLIAYGENMSHLLKYSGIKGKFIDLTLN